MHIDATLWKRLITLIRDATPQDARLILSKGGDSRPKPVEQWLPKVQAVRPEFARLILEANHQSTVEPSTEANEYVREAWNAAIAELTSANEPEYKFFRRPGAAEREARFQLQDDLERAKSAALQLAADLESEMAKREAAQVELGVLKQRGWLARLLNR